MSGPLDRTECGECRGRSSAVGVEPLDHAGFEYDPEAGVETVDLLAEAVAFATELDPAREVETAVGFGSPARTILDYVDEHGVDHVVMGSHGRSSVPRLVFGSVAERVIRQSPIPVTVVR